MFFLVSCLGGLVSYLYFLNKRLSSSNPAARAFAAKLFSDEELANVTYPNTRDIIEAIIATGSTTGRAYVVTGGSGFVGSYIVRTLLARGETLIRIIDIAPPDVSGDSNAPDHISRAEFIQADITDFNSVKEAISKPFGNTGMTAHVVIHTAAAVRFWERLPYLKHYCYNVNVKGTQNVLRTSQDLGTVRSFVSTSSITVQAPPARHLRLIPPRLFMLDDAPKGLSLANHHYPATKREADALVREADNVKGMRTGVIRPGMVVVGPGDGAVTIYLKNTGPNVTWGGEFLSTMVNVWDLARAHIQLTDALETRPDEVAGTAFAITGMPAPISNKDKLRVVQFYSRRDLRIQQAPALVFYIMSHFLELFFFIRYHVLQLLFEVTRKTPSLVPQWAITSKVFMLQPSTWEFMCGDYIIDDSRARKILGYQHLWTNEQTLRWIVDTVEGRST